MKRTPYFFKSLGAACMLTLGCCGTVAAQGVAMEWAQQLTSTGQYSNPHMITTDAAGDVYVTGGFSGTMDFDPGPGVANLTAEGFADVFVLKMDGQGKVIWVKQMGGLTESDRGRAITVDSAGNVYTTGIFYGTADFDPGPGFEYLTAATMGWSDVFISKLDKDGSFVWAKSLGNSGADEGNAIAIGPDGNVYIYGNFDGKVDFDPGSGTFEMTAANTSGFLLNLDKSGDFVWAKQFSGSGTMLPASMAISPSGNFYLLGTVMMGDVDADPGAGTKLITAVGMLDPFVIKLDNKANFVWARQFEGGAWEMAIGVNLAIDQNENVLTTGVLMGTFDFDPGPATYPLKAKGGSDIFISKLDTDGNFVWACASEGSASSAVAESNSIAIDSKGNVFATGFFKGTVDFKAGTETSRMTSVKDKNDAFIIKVNAAGNLSWAKQLGGDGVCNANSITVDHSGNVYSTGFFSDTCDVDPNSGVHNFVATGGTADIYIHKMICTDTTSSVLEITAPCEGYVFGDITYTTSGTYTRVVPNAAGCDSTIRLELTVTPLEVFITVEEFLLSTTETYEQYEWLLNGNLIEGADESTYEVKENGDYQVVVTNDKGCIDTSGIYTITNYTGIESAHHLAGQIRVYPNPTQDLVTIRAPFKVNILLTDIAGKTLNEGQQANTISLRSLADGIYFLQLRDQNGRLLKTEKIVKSQL